MQGTRGATLHADPCSVYIISSYYYTLLCCVSCGFSASGVSFAVCGVVTVFTAVKALSDLKLWDVPFCGIMEVIEVAVILNCCTVVVQIDYGGGASFCRRVLCFCGGEEWFWWWFRFESCWRFPVAWWFCCLPGLARRRALRWWQFHSLACVFWRRQKLCSNG